MKRWTYRIMRPLILAGALGLLSMTGITDSAQAGPYDTMDQLTTYIQVLGRAQACGIDTTEASRRVGSWVDRMSRPGSDERKAYMQVILVGLPYVVEQQRQGRTADSCANVRRYWPTMRWP